MAAKIPKRAKLVEHKEAEEEEDRLSNLPDPIIHHIFSFIPTTEVVKTCVLSKRWRLLWVYNPSLHATETEKFREGKFYDLVDTCLKLQNICGLERFKLKTCYYGVRDHIDGWLRIILGRSKVLKEMDLCMKHCRRWYGFSLGKSCNLKSLTVLKLEDIGLEAFEFVELPWLKVVSLKKLTLKNLLLCCSSIEDLVLDSCHGLGKTKTIISSPSLKSFLIRHLTRGCDRSIRVEAANLESFAYDTGSFSTKNMYDVDISACVRVRSVSLWRVALDDQWMEGLVLTYLQLEKLRLENCTGLKNVNIRSQKLKALDLSFFGSRSEVEATNIDAPNLVSFSYRFEGKTKQKFSIRAPNLLEACITLVSDSKPAYSIEWYVNLIDFLRNFDRCKSLRLKSDGEV